MIFPLRVLFALSVLLCMAGSELVKAAEVQNFHNVLMQDGADPSIVRHADGWYYFTRTTSGNVRLWRSRTLTGLGAGDSMVIWSASPGTAYSSNIWAPELQFIDGKWYVYFAADDGNNANHRMFVLENTHADPFQGSWTFRGKIADATDRWAIDGVAFEVGERKYFIWSGWEGSTDGEQNLYIAEMSNPWTISSARTRISTPTHSWEINHSPHVNEGPEVVVRNGTINLVYSASGSWTDDYALGLITADISADLLAPASWTKRPSPVFSSTTGIYGPGHHTLTTSPDGTEDWIVYHSARWQGSGWTRQIRTQKFTWSSDCTPLFGTPAPRYTPLTLPSGEIDRQRHEAEDAVLSGTATAVTSTNASGGEAVGFIDTVESGVTFTVEVPAAGRYNIAALTASGMSGGGTHLVSANGGTAKSLSVVRSGWGNWSTASIWFNLNAGINTIRFAKGDSYAELDAIDIFPYETYGPEVAAPASLAAEAGDRFVRLDWPGAVARTYSVWRRVNGGGWASIASGLPMPAFVDQGVTNGTDYEYAVTAISQMGRESAMSTLASATPLAGDGTPLLVALYTMESGARDSGGRKFHGSGTGGLSSVAGRIDQSASGFNGTAARAEVPNTLSRSFSISFWMQTTRTGGGPQWYQGLGLVDGEVGGATSDFGLALVGNRVGFGIGDPDITLTSSAVVNDGSWHHIGATRNGDTGEMRLYVDGVLQGMADGSPVPRTASPTLHIGSLRTGIGYLAGGIDELRLYDGVLPPEGVIVLANPDQRMVAHYPLDGTTSDLSGFAHHGTNSGSMTVAEGIHGQAVVFNGNGSVRVPASVTGDFSIACWVKTTATGGNGTQWYQGSGIVDGEVPGVTHDFGLVLLEGKAAFGVGNPDRTILSQQPINDGQWHHLMATRTNQNGETRLYIDGTLSSVSGTGMPTGSRIAIEALRIGALATGNRGFAGSIDEVKLFNHVLSASAAAVLAALPPAFAAIADQSIAENTSTGVLPLQTSGWTPSRIITVASSDPVLTPASGIVVAGTGPAPTVLITPAPGRAGTATITVTIAEGDSSISRSFVLTVTTTPAGEWRQAWFGNTADTGLARTDADPDGDGYDNGWERYFGGNPTAADPGTHPHTALVNGFLQIDYTRSLAAGDLQVQVEWSTGLGSWSHEGIEDISEEIDNGIDHRRARLATGDHASLFFRLRRCD